MSTYPIAYHQVPTVDRSRLTVFFRVFLAISHLIVSLFYGFAAAVVGFLAWFAIIFTGRYPAGMYNFVAGYLRYSARINGYMFLVTDEYPPFDGSELPDYPVGLSIPPPQESYSRLTTFFRIILLIPVFVLLYVFNLWIQAVAIALWFVAVIMGKTSVGFVNAHLFPLAYMWRSYAYAYLLTDGWPPLDD